MIVKEARKASACGVFAKADIFHWSVYLWRRFGKDRHRCFAAYDSSQYHSIFKRYTPWSVCWASASPNIL